MHIRGYFMPTDNKAVPLSLTLPKKTLELADHMWQKEQYKSRSAFVDEAIRWYATALQKKKLRAELIRGYQAHADDDMSVAAEWDITLVDGLESE